MVDRRQGCDGRGGTREEGVALVELALVLPFLALLVLGTIDLGRAFRLGTRLENSAREGAAFAQFHPTKVDSGCEGTSNVVDRARAEDDALPVLPGYSVTVFKRDPSSGALLPPAGYTACGTVTSVSLAPGDEVVVRVQASFSPLTPLVSRLTGTPITLTAREQVVVQG